jgi:hypothetical protein
MGIYCCLQVAAAHQDPLFPRHGASSVAQEHQWADSCIRGASEIWKGSICSGASLKHAGSAPLPWGHGGESSQRPEGILREAHVVLSCTRKLTWFAGAIRLILPPGETKRGWAEPSRSGWMALGGTGCVTVWPGCGRSAQSFARPQN